MSSGHVRGSGSRRIFSSRFIPPGMAELIGLWIPVTGPSLLGVAKRFREPDERVVDR